jgi:formylglycine-generating enzyme required for sulfatase activity
MVRLGAYAIDAYEASRFDATDQDAGADDGSGACSRPGVLPWRDLTWFEARDACAAVGKRLCTADEWADACDGTPGEGGRTYPYGDTYGPDTCNGRDRDTGIQPTGSLPFCVTPEGVLDLSGNVSEWLATEVAPGARGVRGGAARGSDNFLQCAPLDRYAPDQAFGLRGFRCCRDAP